MPHRRKVHGSYWELLIIAASARPKPTQIIDLIFIKYVKSTEKLAGIRCMQTHQVIDSQTIGKECLQGKIKSRDREK